MNRGIESSDTVKGAVASANLYSLVETAKANGVEPHAYLSHLFEKVPYAKGVEDFEALLPATNTCRSSKRPR
jgi:transposase